MRKIIEHDTNDYIEPKNGPFVHKDGSLRHYKNGLLHNETGPSIDYNYTNNKSYFFQMVEYHLDGIPITNWDNPDPKVQELRKYKEARDLLLV